ncbi:hypothetical protein LINPERPRIM_LOCUS25325 [Linum perenne]
MKLRRINMFRRFIASGDEKTFVLVYIWEVYWQVTFDVVNLDLKKCILLSLK